VTNTRIRTTRLANLALVSVDGPIRAGDSEQAFVDAMDAILRGGDLHVILDLSSVPHVDSTGLGRILQAVCRFQRAGGALKLYQPSHYVRNLLAITRVTPLVQIADSVDRSSSASEGASYPSA
jgi:anti-anti-sigma factor